MTHSTCTSHTRCAVTAHSPSVRCSAFQHASLCIGCIKSARTCVLPQLLAVRCMCDFAECVIKPLTSCAVLGWCGVVCAAMNVYHNVTGRDLSLDHHGAACNMVSPNLHGCTHAPHDMLQAHVATRDAYWKHVMVPCGPRAHMTTCMGHTARF